MIVWREALRNAQNTNRKIDWLLGALGVLLAVGQVLTATPDSWIAVHSPIPLFAGGETCPR